jgi:hypothetical protein
MLEENDYLQGFQILADTDNGFSSFASKLIDLIDDECGKRMKFVFSITNSDKIKQENKYIKL